MTVLPFASIFSSIATLPASLWIDIASLVVLIVCVVYDCIKGFSANLSRVAALIISFKLAFATCPFIRTSLASFGATKEVTSSIIPIILAIVLLIILFIILNYLFAKFIRILVPSPVDNILGALTGSLKALLLIFFVFVVVKLVLFGNYDSSSFAKSKTGSKVVPVIERIVATSYSMVKNTSK